jgi:acetyl esterase/lipase
MSKLLTLLVLAGLPLSALSADDKTRGQVKEFAVRETMDLRYFPGKDRQTLDIFAPRGSASERFPVVLIVHGGTWMFGDKNFFGINRGVGRALARQGVVSVVINYRLSPLVKHPEHAKDVARAFAWTVKNIDRYGGDPDRVFLLGHSAGGHLAALVATDESYLASEELKLTSRQRKALRGVISLSGVYRIPPPEEFRGMIDAIVRSLIGEPKVPSLALMITPALRAAGRNANPFSLVFGTDRDVQMKASPLSHVHKGLPPFLLLVAQKEVPGLAKMADDFESALKSAGTTVSLHQIADTSHRTIIHRLHKPDDETTRLVMEFIEKYAGQDKRGDS